MAGTSRNTTPSHERVDGQQLVGIYYEAEPYRRLWASKMLLMVTDYTTHLRAVHSKKNSTAKMYASKHGLAAAKWIFSDDTDIGSFVWTCGVLGLDPQRVRTSVERNWRKIKGGSRDVRAVRKSEETLP